MYGRARQALLMKDSRCRPRRNFVFLREPFGATYVAGQWIPSFRDFVLTKSLFFSIFGPILWVRASGFWGIGKQRGDGVG